MKPKFNDDELRRAREITRGLSKPETRSPDLVDIAGEPQSRAPLIFVALVLVIALSVAGWILFSNPDHVRLHDSVSPVSSTSEPASLIPANAARSGGPLSLSPASPLSTASVPVRKATTTKPAAPAPRPQRTQPVPTSAARAQSQPTRSSREAIQQRHQVFVEREAERYFLEDYRLGSNDLSIRRVEVTPLRTESVAGWPRYRSFGNVEIEYYVGSGQVRTTRRGYEALTEESNGQVKLVEFTPKWQPLDH